MLLVNQHGRWSRELKRSITSGKHGERSRVSVGNGGKHLTTVKREGKCKAAQAKCGKTRSRYKAREDM